MCVKHGEVKCYNHTSIDIADRMLFTCPISHKIREGSAFAPCLRLIIDALELEMVELDDREGSVTRHVAQRISSTAPQ